MNKHDRHEVLAIIPARGGSKGIPCKNIRLLAGKPLLAYTIENALKTTLIDRVVASRDDCEIAGVARRYGAEVIRRSAEISRDTASSESALLHVLDHLKDTEGYQPDLVVFLQCTSPLTLPEDIEGTIRVIWDERADSALAVTSFDYFLWKDDGTGNAFGINHNKAYRPLRQEREPQFLETGAVYVMRMQGFRAARHRFFGKTGLYLMPPERCLEIDLPEDLLVADALLRARQEKEKLQALPKSVAAVILDFDGVFTDNRVVVFQDGREGVVCDRGDGWGLAQLKKRGLPILVLSSEENPVVQARCHKLGIACIQGLQDKLTALLEWLRKREIDPSKVVYVGNDVNDLACLNAVGCSAVVRDAHPQARSSARIILSKAGGRGAIREIADLIMQRMEG